MPKRVAHRRACHQCKTRHLKCDAVKPICTPCMQGGRECVEVRYTFRYDHNPGTFSRSGRAEQQVPNFEPHQTWLPINTGSVEFVEVDSFSDVSDKEDEVSYNPEDRDCEDDPTSLLRPRLLPRPEPETNHVGSDHLSPGNQSPVTFATRSRSEYPSPLPRLSTPTNLVLPPLRFLSPSQHQYTAITLGGHDSNASITKPREVRSSLFNIAHSLTDKASGNAASNQFCLWPLSTDGEAMLMKYFIDTLSIWFDYCDPQRHFLHQVVRAASANSTLSNAILAVSAKHLSLSGNFDRYAPDRYQQKCLQKLIPALNDHDSLLDETLFAATIILRLLDEMTEPIGTTHRQGHVLGTHFLMRAHQEPASESTLRTASLVIGLRQEILISFMTRKPMPPVADYCQIDRSLGPADDRTWALRMVAHASDVLNYCYGSRQHDLERWTSLWQYIEDWIMHRPSSFSPIKYAEPDAAEGEAFPVAWFLNDCHVAGHQYLGICRILLLAHDPQIPTLGPGRNRLVQQSDEQIKSQVRLLCGIALSNRHFTPAIFTAGMAVAMCGERFTDPVEQRQLMKILAETEEHLAWPSLKFKGSLEKQWNMQY